MVWAVIALVLLAVAVVCLVRPVEITLRAPDDGDLFSLKVRHPAASLDLWLPTDTVIYWIGGFPEPPPIAGHIAGIPLPQRALDPIAKKIGEAVAGIGKKKEPEPEKEPKKPGRFDALKKHAISAAPGIAWEQRSRFGRAIVVEVFAFDLDYGTGDPVSTGMIAGFLWQLAALLPEPAYVRAEAHWLEPTLRVEGEARVLIFPWRTIVAVICLLLAIARAAWKASRKPPDKKESDAQWPIRTETPAAVAPPSSPS